MIETDRLFLEPLSLKHLSQSYTNWFNDEEVCRYNRHNAGGYTIEKTKSYIKSIENRSDIKVFAIIEKISSLHIGNIAIQKIDYQNRHADISIIIGEKKCWGKGYAKEAYRSIFAYGFKTLKMHKLYIGTSQENIAMQNVAKSLKMSFDGVLRDQIYKNNKFSDILIYSILVDEFEK